MTVRRRLWQGAVFLSTLLLALPLWMQGNRADPLYLLPLLGWATLAFVSENTGWQSALTWAGRSVGFAAVCVSLATWAVSGSFAIVQLVILSLLAVPILFLHQMIAARLSMVPRLVLHALLALLWVPVGMALADASYRWPEPAERPRVALLSSMPLVWGSAAGDLFPALKGESAPAPILSLLRDGAQVTAVDYVTPEVLLSTDVLLLIQPRTMLAGSLVAIDDWVRGGGRVLWLADPDLQSGQDFPLGDRRNPEISEPNVALLFRWGLRMAVHGDADATLVRARDDGLPLILQSPGRWVSNARHCQLRANAIIADCRVGRGRVVILADADMVDARWWARAETATAEHPFLWVSGNGRWVLAAVRQLGGADANSRLVEPIWLRPSLTR